MGLDANSIQGYGLELTDIALKIEQLHPNPSGRDWDEDSLWEIVSEDFNDQFYNNPQETLGLYFYFGMNIDETYLYFPDISTDAVSEFGGNVSIQQLSFPEAKKILSDTLLESPFKKYVTPEELESIIDDSFDTINDVDYS